MEGINQKKPYIPLAMAGHLVQNQVPLRTLCEGRLGNRPARVRSAIYCNKFESISIFMIMTVWSNPPGPYLIGFTRPATFESTVKSDNADITE